MATGGMNASSTSPDTSGYSGPAPMFGNNPPASRSGPSMTPTPPTNPLPAPPSPQPAVMPATGPAPTPVMPSYGGYQRPDFGGFMGGGQGMMPADRMSQFGRFGGFGGFDPFAGFGFLRSNRGPATPTWSQQGGVYNYNPNGRPEGMANPFIGNMMDRFGQKQQMLMDRVAQQRQMIAERLPQTAAGAPTMGLGAINPYAPSPPPLLPGGPQTQVTPTQTASMQQYNPQMPGKPLTLEELKQTGAQVMPLNPAYGQQLSSQSVASPMSGGQSSQDMLQQSYQDFLQQQRIK